jgi:hypothetical protein
MGDHFQGNADLKVLIVEKWGVKKAGPMTGTADEPT